MATVRSCVDEYVGEAPQFDDLTMLVLVYNGTHVEEMKAKDSIKK